MEKIYQADINRVKKLLYTWIKNASPSSGMEWLDKKLALLHNSANKKDIFLAFSSASRFIPKATITISDDELEEAMKLRSGWTPSGWSADQCARILLLLSISHQDSDDFNQILHQLFETAEVAELTALYLGFPLYPFPEKLKLRAIEGFRTNMSVVFNAISLHNPYPKDHLDEAAWNQMILKAIFIGSPLYKIQGIEERANATLANIASDFAHERWAAHRSVSPELWRVVGPFINAKNIADLEKVILDEDALQQLAALLACKSSKSELAHALLLKHKDLISKIPNSASTWDEIGKEYEQEQK